MAVIDRSGLLALALLVLPLAGCASRQDVMTPITLAAGAAGTAPTVDMMVATTRAASSDRALMFTGERGNDLTLANVVVSLPPDDARQPGTIQWPSPGSTDPRASFLTLKAQPMPESEVLPWFRRNAGGTRRVMIFVHGFNNGYADAIYRFAQVAHDLKIKAAPVLFTWPSRASALDYPYDRESATYSRFGLMLGLEQAIASPDVAEITIVAHSMGAWLTAEALRDLGLKHGGVSPKVRTVVLASPDIDVDVFKRQVIEMGKTRPRFIVVTSRNDLALRLSRWIAGDIDRLGGADLRRDIDFLKTLGIEVIDATDVKSDDPSGHNAYAASNTILKTLAEDMAKGAALALRPILGRRAAAAR